MSDKEEKPPAETAPPPEAGAAETPAAPAATPTGRQPRASLPGLLLISIALIVVMRSAFLVLMLGLLPSMAAYISDRTPSKYKFRCVFFCNFAGVMPYAMALSSAAIGDILQAVRDAQMWLVILSAAALGWGIVWLTPLIVRLVLKFYYAERAVMLTRSNQILVADWGLGK